MLQVMTPTGARPEAFAHCQRWAAAQDYQDAVRWIIVDDGPDPQVVGKMPPNWSVIVIRPAPFWRQGENTQGRNILKGLEAVNREDPLVIMEDDDYYAPSWLSHVLGHLKHAPLVGEKRSRYYNIKTRVGRELPNEFHASLCACAMVESGIDAFRKAAETKAKFIDMHLWRANVRKRLFAGHKVVGIKGLPGRGGIGIGHRDSFAGRRDPGGELLRSWIGSDAEYYL